MQVPLDIKHVFECPLRSLHALGFDVVIIRFEKGSQPPISYETSAASANVNNRQQRCIKRADVFGNNRQTLPYTPYLIF